MAETEYTTIDQYIALYDGDVKKRLTALRKTIHKAAPDAIEKISWSMPTFWQGENLIHFAAAKHHIGIYPGAEGVEAFLGELEDYKTSKGAIQLPNDKPLPLDLVARITRFRVEHRRGR
jgi:uncharacterized protein YdhG (YjbR/CyaY superfamily)